MLNIDALISNLKRFRWNSTKTGGTSLCPYHVDSHPSFGISGTKNAFHCFSCGEHGNLYALCKKLGIPFSSISVITKKELEDADYMFQQTYGDVDVDALEPDHFSNIIDDYKDAITDPTKDTERYLYDHPFLDYRKITNKLKDELKIRYDNKMAALFVPIYDKKGNIISNFRRFKTSVKNKKMMYPRSFKMNKSLYGLHKFKGQKTVLITEGILDTTSTYVNLDAEGLLEYILPISSYSATNFNKQHVQMLKFYGFKNVIVLFDNDLAGENGFYNIKNICKGNKTFKLWKPNKECWPEDCKDPDDLYPQELVRLLKSIERVEL